MLTAEENELLTRIEGDAPMGQMMRHHWIPALMTEEVPEPDGTPVRVRLFGENLVAFRDTDGRVGIEWGVYGVPETFVVDGEGRIVHKHIGPITPESWQNDILPIIQEHR